MGLQTKFNLVLGVIFATGLAIAGYISYSTEMRQAHELITRDANFVMEAALAVRAYTVQEIGPLSDASPTDAFLPQSVPSYAAHQTFAHLVDSGNFSDYRYQEASLNPTNWKNRATDWQVGIIQQFRSNPNTTEIIGQRMTDRGETLYLAHPIKVDNIACLQCHSTPDKAPEHMLKVYGSANGFGWQLNESIGAQIVTAPSSLCQQHARKSVLTALGALCSVFALVFIATNLMLRKSIIDPLTEISDITDEFSRDPRDAPEFSAVRSDQLGALQHSINRLRRSLGKAMALLEDRDNRRV